MYINAMYVYIYSIYVGDTVVTKLGRLDIHSTSKG